MHFSDFCPEPLLPPANRHKRDTLLRDPNHRLKNTDDNPASEQQEQDREDAGASSYKKTKSKNTRRGADCAGYDR
jgi:hypothetical protein